MLEPIRRVVTGLNAEGRAAVIYDGPAGTTAENPHWPGTGVTLLWRTDQAPASNAGDADPVGPDVPFRIEPRTGGASFMLVQMPPDRELEAMTPEARARAKAPSTMMAEAEIAEGSHPGMHTTRTVEFTVMLAGEITLLLEEGEVTLRAGDTLVNRGVAHAWENRGEGPALKAVVMIDAEYLDVLPPSRGNGRD